MDAVDSTTYEDSLNSTTSQQLFSQVVGVALSKLLLSIVILLLEHKRINFFKMLRLIVYQQYYFYIVLSFYNGTLVFSKVSIERVLI